MNDDAGSRGRDDVQRSFISLVYCLGTRWDLDRIYIDSRVPICENDLPSAVVVFVFLDV